MGYGGYHPYPRRFGGGKPQLEVVHQSLNRALGTAFDATNPDTATWVETMAYARALVFDGWEVGRRMSLQWDPRKTTDMLPRWERIFGIPSPYGVPDRLRRKELTARWRLFGISATHTVMQDTLTDAIPDYFVGIEYISAANAYVISPDASYPWGVQNDYGITWLSTQAHILIRLQKPTSKTEADFYRAARKVFSLLDDIVPAWQTFDWYRAPVSTPIAIVGGPSAAGFYLDDDHNLDNNVFDV